MIAPDHAGGGSDKTDQSVWPLFVEAFDDASLRLLDKSQNLISFGGLFKIVTKKSMAMVVFRFCWKMIL